MAPNNLNIGQKPSITVGGRVFTDLDNLIVLHAFCDYSAVSKYSTFRRGSTGYQVTVGKTLKIYAVKFNPFGTSQAGRISLGYGDTDVGVNSASAPTNFASLTGTSEYLSAPALPATPQQQEFALDGNISVAATKYPCVFNDGAAISTEVLIYCYEV